MYIRAKTHIETDDKTGRETIIVDEIPYQVNKARLIEKIAELVKEKRIEGISALRDESDKDGMRIVMNSSGGESSDVMLNHLYTQTQMQTVFVSTWWHWIRASRSCGSEANSGMFCPAPSRSRHTPHRV